MATKDIVLEGNTYSGIDNIELPTSGGGTAKFTEISDTTATSGTVIDGEIFYTASGTKSTGTAVIPTKLSDLTNDLVVSDFTNDAGYLTSYTETDPTVPSWAKASSKPTYTASEVGAVPTTRTVNNKALSSNITLTASDVGALPSSTSIPSKTSDLTNDSGFLTSETDPTVPSWAKALSKPSYTASEVGAVPTTRTVNSKALSSDITLSASDVGALPSTTSIPSKVSDLTNDSGFITAETDPTVPSWAKASSKPTYTASEVGALPSTTYIPTKTSDLTNDSGYITLSAIPTNVSSFTNDAGYLTAHQDISGKADKTDTDIDSAVTTLAASMGWVAP